MDVLIKVYVILQVDFGDIMELDPDHDAKEPEA